MPGGPADCNALGSCEGNSQRVDGLKRGQKKLSDILHITKKSQWGWFLCSARIPRSLGAGGLYLSSSAYETFSFKHC